MVRHLNKGLSPVKPAASWVVLDFYPGNAFFEKSAISKEDERRSLSLMIRCLYGISLLELGST